MRRLRQSILNLRLREGIIKKRNFVRGKKITNGARGDQQFIIFFNNLIFLFRKIDFFDNLKRQSKSDHFDSSEILQPWFITHGHTHRHIGGMDILVKWISHLYTGVKCWPESFSTKPTVVASLALCKSNFSSNCHQLQFIRLLHLFEFSPLCVLKFRTKPTVVTSLVLCNL